MRNMLTRLWADDAGFIVSTELMITATLLVIGLLVGQVTLRDAVLSELGDLAQAINDTNQSYSYTSVTGHSSSVAGAEFADRADFCDDNDDTTQGSQGSGDGACIGISVAPDAEDT
ncbi:MAG: hypothetical protein O2820_02465 [Planctomycetota bacterium]|nr:hypothetical protein [Planctomycetota bacterium]MDA1248064.1 hypothetical protein [Planctomycetota bacterium]